MPGFIDSHTHPVISSFLHDMIDLSGFTHTSKEQVWNHLTNKLSEYNPGEWILCKGFDQILVPGLTPPHISYLDSIAPDNPLLVVSQNLHSYWANSLAFHEAGVDLLTPNPDKSSYYEKDSLEKFTGYIAEQAAFEPFKKTILKSLGISRLKENSLMTMKEYAKNGWTSITSMGITTSNKKVIQLYKHISSKSSNLINNLLSVIGILPNREHTVRNFVFVRHDAPHLLPKSISNGDDFLKTISAPAAKSLRARKEQINLDDSTIKTVKEAYYATTSFVDAQVGKVLDKLKETGLDKNTIVVFTSDHGYHLGEKGHWQKQTLYDRATRVPLIISGPGIISGLKIKDSPVELVDLYKTIMDMANVSTPEFVQGFSLKDVLTKNIQPKRKSALSEINVYLEGKKAQGYSIKTDRFRLIKWNHKEENYYELYDHKFEKEEKVNLVNNPKYNKVIDSLKVILDNRITAARKKPKGLGRQFKNAKPNFEPKRIYSSEKSKL